MCLPSGLAAMFGLSFIYCNAEPNPGPDPYLNTYASEVFSARDQIIGYKVSCPKSTADCLSRAQAICQGAYEVVDRPMRSPRLQALVNNEIVTINTDNPHELLIKCADQAPR
jgi:hypothetical protein